MEEVFGIDRFNIIEDEENYYFFRALNMGDDKDIEEGTVLSESGRIQKIRTDRERYEESNDDRVPKYNKDSKISLEQVYDHIKMRHRKDTNCISLSSNANVAINYGRRNYKDKYILVKVPKKEIGEKVINAGQYMLEEIERKIDEYVSSTDIDNELKEILSRIENSKTSDELKEIIQTRYTTRESIDTTKSRLRKEIIYRAPIAIVSKYKSLDEEQQLQKNKIIARLIALEKMGRMQPIIPHTANNQLLIRTVGNAFSSLELIHYGDIDEKEIIELPKEVVDIFALLQQLEGVDKKDVTELKREIIRFLSENRNFEELQNIDISENYILKDNISIEEMYKLTEGKVEYGEANSVIRNMFYLTKSQSNARQFSKVLNHIIGDNPKYKEIINNITRNGFWIEPNIITRRSDKGFKISESLSLDLKDDEISLIDKIKELSEEEQKEILENGGLSNVKNIMNDTFSKSQRNEKISREEYYAEAILALYNWQSIGIEEIKEEERNQLIQGIKDGYCVELYEKLEEQGIDRKDIPSILLNMIIRKNDFEITEQDTEETIKEKRLKQYDEMLKGDIIDINQEISIERIERFLGYYDVQGTGIQLREYQQEAVERVDEIFKTRKFASVILPTGAGKTFVSLSELIKNKDRKMLYMAPQNEILEQVKDYIIKYIHGPVNTLGRTKEEIIKDIFPNLEFSTYSGLLTKQGKEIINKKYDFIVLDELHRTGAENWNKKLNELIDNQTEDIKVLGITATPRRDVDGINMANEMAEKLGYTNEEAVSGKHIAMNMSLINAIRMGIVVNPKLVSCAYNLKIDGSLEKLKEKIDLIEDVEKHNKKLQEYEKLVKNIDKSEGILEILKANVKKSGKYIVFLPVVDEIEDEDGNVTGRKKGKQKIEDYKKQIAEYFKGSDIVPNFHSMLGEYGNKENARRLERFQSANTDSTEFLLVMNKANEGLHIDNLDGIIWLRPIDEKSRILYLQQLGRILYAMDPDYPIKDEDIPKVIDLVNNTLRVNWRDEITEQDDIQMLNMIIEWGEKRNGKVPDINSSNKEEIRYAKILKEIQEKYKRYLENEDDILNEKQKEEIREILKIGSLIDLWEIELPDKIKTSIEGNRKSYTNNDMESFEIVGVLKDFVELEDEVDEINDMSSIDKFIDTLKKLRKVGVDVTKISTIDTIETLSEKSGIGIEKIEEIGLEPNNNIGRTKLNISRAYRGTNDYKKPTEEQVEELKS